MADLHRYHKGITGYDGVGEIDKNTRSILYSKWINLVNATLGEYGYTPHVVDIYGNETSPQNCKDIVGNLKCEDEDDIIVFYYVGHGTENTGTSKYPLMAMAQKNVDKLIPLSWVHETLKDKNARLTISIGMCCNGNQNVPGRIAPSFALNYDNTKVDPKTAECIKKMFLCYKGDLIVTSSSPGEESHVCTSLSLGNTDYFTLNLIDQFNNVLPEIDNPNWENMMKEIKESVSDSVRQNPGLQSRYPDSTQTPIWDNNLVAAAPPQKGKMVRPNLNFNQNPSLNSNSNNLTNRKTLLNKVLAFISSSSVSKSERKEVAEELKGAFQSDLVVKILSQDKGIVVDKENINAFLNYISTSDLLMNVSVDDLDIDQNGIINLLKVREIFKNRK